MDKLRLLQDSYKEVLDATKHQDDKVGRFLTAVAFLIGGSIALGTRTDLAAASYQIDALPAEPVLLPAYLLSLFLLFVAVSLLLLVTGLGARLYRPDERPGTSDSHLFFFLIAEMYERNPVEWDRLWLGDAVTISQSLITEYKREIPNIARRATLKYRRTLYAGAFLQFAILLLVLAAVLGFLAGSFPTTTAYSATDPSVDWTALMPRLVVASVIAVAALVLALDFLWFERFGNSQRWMRRSLVLLCPTYVVVVLVHSGDAYGIWNTLGLFAIGTPIQVVIVLAGVVASWNAWQGTGARVSILAVAAIFIFGPVIFLSFGRLELGHLVAAILVIPLLLAMRVLVRPFASEDAISG